MIEKRIKLDESYVTKCTPQHNYYNFHYQYEQSKSVQQQKIREEESITTKYTQRFNPTMINCFNEKMLFKIDKIDIHSIGIHYILQYSFIEGYQLLNQIMAQNIEDLIHLMHQNVIQLHPQLILYFLKTNTFCSPEMIDIACIYAQSLDKHERMASLIALVQLNITDEQFMLACIKKPQDSGDLILSKGQKGLLTSILEDQYFDIRIHGIKVINSFISKSALFAQQVQEILVYMLNDETDQVRIEAMKVIQQSYNNVEFNRNDVNSMRFNLIEHNKKLRIAIYELISQATFTEVSLLLDIYNQMCSNINKFPEDFHYIIKALIKFGQTNKDKLSILEILQFRERLTQEPDWMNQEYQARMFYAFHSTTRSSKDPFYFNKHFDFLQNQYPEHFESPVTQDDIDSLLIFQSLQKWITEISQTYLVQVSEFLIEKTIKTFYQLHAQYEVQNFDFNIEEVKILSQKGPTPQQRQTYKIPDNYVGQFQFIYDLKQRLKQQIYSYTDIKFVPRVANIIIPNKQQVFKVFADFYLEIKVAFEFSLLKEPINKHYAIQLTYLDKQIELHKIGKYDIEGRLINRKVQLKRLIIDFSQQLQISLIEICDNYQIQIGKSVTVLLQV